MRKRQRESASGSSWDYTTGKRKKRRRRKRKPVLARVPARLSNRRKGSAARVKILG